MWPFSKPDPLRALSRTIVRASVYSADAFRPFLEDREAADRAASHWAILCEYVGLFLHLTDREAHELLGAGRRSVLMDKLGPMVVEPLVRTYFPNWPASSHAKFTSTFYDQLNEAQVEYASSRELMSEDHRKFFRGDSIISKMARRVAGEYGSPDNPEVLMWAMEACVPQIGKLRLKPLIMDAVRSRS